MSALKKLQELINTEDPGWPVVQGWIAEAKNPVEVLPPISDAKREVSLLATQVTTRSPMGAVIYETGGILVDRGWLRILGSGNPRLPRSVADWNFGRSFKRDGDQPSFLLIADDVVGGFFAIDGGGLKMQPGKVCYFAPDTAAWENLNLGYSEFLCWCLDGDIQKFYETVRWPGWEQDVKMINGDQAFFFYPLLNTSNEPMGQRKRSAAPVAEIYDLQVGRPNN